MQEILYNKKRLNESRWSSGQDVALSRRNQGFDSPTGYQRKSASNQVFSTGLGAFIFFHITIMWIFIVLI
jgi:hypothetical protein